MWIYNNTNKVIRFFKIILSSVAIYYIFGVGGGEGYFLADMHDCRWYLLFD